MECYACAKEAARQCRRCARVYCEVHGGEFCAECLSPASALPSFNLYRGSLLALLVGTAIALWLLVRPPGPGEGGQEVVIVEFTPTPIVTPFQPTSTATIETVTPTGPPEKETPTSTPAARTYTVKQGDSLLTIAEQFTPAGVRPVDFAALIARANGMDADDPIIKPGDVLQIPVP